MTAFGEARHASGVAALLGGARIAQVALGDVATADREAALVAMFLAAQQQLDSLASVGACLHVDRSVEKAPRGIQ